MSALPTLPKLDHTRYTPFASPPPRSNHTPHSAAAAAQQRTQARGSQHGFTTPAAAAASSFASAAAASSARPAAPAAAPFAARAQLRCQSCDSTDLEENALGYWICVDCGAQSHERQALTQEVEEGMFQGMAGQLWRTGTRIRKLKPTARKITREEQEIVASQVVLHAMQGLLQMQTRALILSFGLPPALAEIVGRLWIHYLEWWPLASSQRAHSSDEKDSAEATKDGSPPVVWGATHREMIVRRYVPGHSKAQRTEQVDAMTQRRRETLAKTRGDKTELATAATITQQQEPTPAVLDDGRLYDDDEPAAAVKKPDRKRRFDGDDDDDDQAAEDDDEPEENADNDAEQQPSPARSLPAEDVNDAAMQDAPGALDHADAASPSPEDEPPAAAAARGSTTSSSRNQILLEPGELSLSLSLALLYLGCHLLREPLTMQHLTLWVHLGRIPYFSPRGLPSALAERIAASAKLTTFFHPSAVPSAPRLLALAHRTAGRIAEVMEAQANAAANQAAAVGASTEGVQILLEQSAQLRTWLSSSSSSSSESAFPVDHALAASSSSTSNTSLLLRTWLSQLSFPPALHGVVMELVSILQLSTDKIVARTGASAQSRVRGQAVEGESQTPANILRTTTLQQTMLMACLVLALQLTYGAKPATSKASEEQDGSSQAIDPKASALVKGLDPKLVRQVQEAAAGSGLKRQSSDESVSDAERGPSRSPSAAARPSSASVAAAAAAAPTSLSSSNWRTSSFRLPRTVHESRTLSAEAQTPFVEWVSSVVLSRLQPLKDFEFYTEMLEQIANTKNTAGMQGEEEEEEDDDEEEESVSKERSQPKNHRGPSAVAASSTPVAAAASSDSSSLLSQLSCSEVLSYTTNRSGYYHAAYSSLLQHCAHLIGIRVSSLHHAVQSIIRMARDTKVVQPRSKQRRV